MLLAILGSAFAGFQLIERALAREPAASTTLSRRAEPIFDFCHGHAWIGRFCTTQPPGGRRWVDLCWRVHPPENPLHPLEHIYLDVHLDPSWHWIRQNGLFLFDHIDPYLFDSETLNHDRIPEYTGRSFMTMKVCPHGFVCAQTVDTDRDAKIFCARDERGPLLPWTADTISYWQPWSRNQYYTIELDEILRNHEFVYRGHPITIGRPRRRRGTVASSSSSISRASHPPQL